MAPPPAAGGAARAGRAAADVQDSDAHVIGGHGRHGAAADTVWRALSAQHMQRRATCTSKYMPPVMQGACGRAPRGTADTRARPGGLRTGEARRPPRWAHPSMGSLQSRTVRQRPVPLSRIGPRAVPPARGTEKSCARGGEIKRAQDVHISCCVCA
jgi:hypothetical protein